METEKIKTENRLTIMEQDINTIKEDIKDVKSDIKDIASDIKDHVKWEAEKYEKLDNKYSGKWVEKTLLIVIGIASTAIIGAILKLIFK